MNCDELTSVLQQIRELADKALRVGGRESKSRAQKKPVATAAPSSPGSLPDHILHLRDTGFFRQPKTIDEVHVKLQSAYHCERDRVSMALLRLLKRKKLRKAFKMVNEEKQTAYVW